MFIKFLYQKNTENDVTSVKNASGLIDIAFYIRDGQNNSYSWNKIFKRDIWEHFSFKKMVYEDLDIIIPILSSCKILSYVPHPLYIYYKHDGTTTYSYTNPRLFDIFKAYTDILNDTSIQYIKEAEYCVAKRMLINFDTPGFVYYLKYFIEYSQKFHSKFKDNKYIKEDPYTRGILYLAKVPI
ncbi:glycosyltransferase [Pediococcus claussenii]|nr:hypothetical protein AYR57_04760 [Pediococcus claussenii]ANZ71482.1 hypothetical protein AYR58_04765 [Pediococcus claussenii]KRN19849.1 glycosyltransferase [Pediococcus claussenii]